MAAVAALDTGARTRRATPPPYPRRGVFDAAAPGRQDLGDDSQAWLRALHGPPAIRHAAVGELHTMLLRAAYHELGRRPAALSHVSASELDDLATQAADDALVAILAKLDTFRGASRFTTWAYKFVLLEAGVKARRRAWHGREVCLDAETWPMVAEASAGAQQAVEDHKLLCAIAGSERARGHLRRVLRAARRIRRPRARRRERRRPSARDARAPAGLPGLPRGPRILA
jgi:hypothetical protein